MAQYNVSCPVEYDDRSGNTKVKWVKLGRGFDSKNGSIMIMLDALPVNGKIFLSKDDGSQGGNRKGGYSGGSGYNNRRENHNNGNGYRGDDVPF